MSRFIWIAFLLLIPQSAWGLTEAELLTALGDRFAFVGAAQQSGRRGDNPLNVGGVRLLEKQVLVVSQTGNELRKQTIFYYVNVATGEAFWQHEPKKPTPPITPAQRMENYVRQQITNDVFLYASRISIRGNRSLYNVVMADLSNKSIIVTRAIPSGTITHQVLTSIVPGS